MPSLRALLFLTAVLTGVSLLLGRPSTAHAQPLTWVLDPGLDVDTRERIVGQTSDLPFTLWTTPAAPQAPRAGEQGDPLARATRLAGESGARVVVWTTGREGGLEVTIVDLAGRRVLVREVSFGDAQEHSAALETVGLIVRSALQALADGGEIGVATRPVAETPAVADGPAEDATVASPGVHADTTGEPEDDAVRSEVMLGAGVGLRSFVDDGPAFEGAGALAWRHGRLWLGTSVHASARQRVRAASAAITVAYAGATLDVGAVAFERGVVALVPVTFLSVGRVRRETTRVSEGFVGTSSRAHVDLRVGAGLLARLALGGMVWLTLDVRLELPLQRVIYSVNTDAEASPLARTPRVAPVVGLSVLARIGRAP